MTAPRSTPLHSVHERLGARMVDFAGWDMPVWYQGATDEHHAVRTAAGLFDLSHMAELFLTGPGAAAALDHALLLNASAMPIGRARYTMIVNEQGGIIDDLIAYRLSDEQFLVVANASNGAVVASELTERSIGFDVTVEDRTDDWALVAVQGPLSETIVSELTETPLSDLRYYRILEATVAGTEALVARTGYTGEDGFELLVPSESAEHLWESCSEAGASHGLVPVGLAARDTLRLEAGMPLYGNELSTETTPFDVGSARLAKDRPPDSVGAAALAAAADLPHRRLVGLHPEGRRPARAGYGVHRDGAEIGAITSGAPSPTLDRPIAMALVDVACDIGDTLEIDVRGTLTPATVVELPFYTRPSKES